MIVRAPPELGAERIEEIVKSKRCWIYRNLAESRDLNATSVVREYRNGEGFLYLGRSCRLLLVADAPPTIIDYIVVHELRHFHTWTTPKRSATRSTIIPNFLERKEWLRKNGAAMDV